MPDFPAPTDLLSQTLRFILDLRAQGEALTQSTLILSMPSQVLDAIQIVELEDSIAGTEATLSALAAQLPTLQTELSYALSHYAETYTDIANAPIPDQE